MQLALEIAKLETLPLPELRRLWKHYFKTDCDVKKKDYYISRIAKLITGTKISGNYFFGLERYKE